MLVLDAGVVVLAATVRGVDHLAGLDRSETAVAPLQNVPGARHEEVLARVDEGPVEMILLNGAGKCLGFAEALGGVCVEVGVMPIGVVKDDLVGATDANDLAASPSRAPLAARDDLERAR